MIKCNITDNECRPVIFWNDIEHNILYKVISSDNTEYIGKIFINLIFGKILWFHEDYIRWDEKETLKRYNMQCIEFRGELTLKNL